MNVIANIQYNISTNGYDYRPSITTLNDNLFLSYYSGSTFDGQTSKSSQDIIVVKLDNNLNILGNLQYNISTTGPDYSPYITTINGNIYLTYMTEGGSFNGQISKGGPDIVIVKLDENLNILGNLQNSISINFAEYLPYLTGINGNIYLSYTTNGTFDGQINKGDWDIVLIKLNEELNIIGNLQYTISTNKSDFAYSGTSLTNLNGNIFLSYTTSGNLNSQQRSSNDIILIKIDQELNVLGNLQYDISTNNNDRYAHLTNLNGYLYMAINTQGNINGHENLNNTKDIALFKIDENLNIINSIQETISTDKEDNNPFIYGYNNFLYLTFPTYGNIDGTPNTAFTNIILYKLDENLNIVDELQNTISTPYIDDLNDDDDYRPSITGAGNHIYLTYHTDSSFPGQQQKGPSEIVLLKIALESTNPENEILVSNIKNFIEGDHLILNSTTNYNLYNNLINKLYSTDLDPFYINLLKTIHRNQLKNKYV
jgi:hypothetical protein